MTETTGSEHMPDQAESQTTPDHQAPSTLADPPSGDGEAEVAVAPAVPVDPDPESAIEPAAASVATPEAEPEVVPLPSSWDELELPPSLRSAIETLGWTKPTPVQGRTFATMIAGNDALVQSQTGSGKTGAFCLPWLASRFQPGPARATGVQLIVLLPTRELAKQVCDELVRLAVDTPVAVLPIYGGTAMAPQLDALAAGIHAVVGTPGRILDHIRRRSLDLSKVRTVVLDECDEMLSMGFLEDIRAILSACPDDRQTCLFSATVPREIERIARRHMRDPVWITLSGDEVSAAEIDHAWYSTGNGIKTRDLCDIIMLEDPSSAIVFCNTREETRLVANVLQKNGYSAEALSSDLTQTAREKVMGKFRDRELRFLVATDVAARGIDVSHVSHVINYSFPENAEVYIHRTGRTGRAGRAGMALSIVSPLEIGNFFTLTKLYKSIQFTERQMPPKEELTATRTEVKLDRISREYSAPVSPEWLLLARRLTQDPRGERVVAFLLHEALEGERIAKRVAEIESDESGGESSDQAGFRERSPRRDDRPRGRGDRDRGPRDRGPRDRDRGPRDRDHAGGDRDRAPRREFDRDRDRDQAPPTDAVAPTSLDASPSVESDANRDREPRRRRRGSRDDAPREHVVADLASEPAVSADATVDERASDQPLVELLDLPDGDEANDDAGDEPTNEFGESTDGQEPRKRRRRRRRRKPQEGDADRSSMSEDAEAPAILTEDGVEAHGQGEDVDESDEDSSEAGETEGETEGDPKKRRRRRRRRGKGPATTAAAPAAAPPAVRESTPTADGQANKKKRRRRRKRGDEDGDSDSSESESDVEREMVFEEAPRVSQDEIIIDIDEQELDQVRDEFGEIDELDELTIKGRRRAVLEDLTEEMEVEDLTDRDAQGEADGESYADSDDEEDDDEAEGAAQTPASDRDASDDTETAGESSEESERRKKKRRRRRKKASAVTVPELTCPPHKDFWEVWASKFSAADFQRDEDSRDTDDSVEDEPVHVVHTQAALPEPDYDSDLPLIEDAPDEDSLVRVSLNLGRRHGQKAAHVRALLRRLTGLHGKAVKDLTVGDRTSLFRMDARHFETVVARLDGGVVEEVTLTLTQLGDGSDGDEAEVPVLRVPQPILEAVVAAVAATVTEPEPDSGPEPEPAPIEQAEVVSTSSDEV